LFLEFIISLLEVNQQILKAKVSAKNLL
jgi:hypothetical protein